VSNTAREKQAKMYIFGILGVQLETSK